MKLARPSTAAKSTEPGATGPPTEPRATDPPTEPIATDPPTEPIATITTVVTTPPQAEVAQTTQGPVAIVGQRVEATTVTATRTPTTGAAMLVGGISWFESQNNIHS